MVGPSISTRPSLWSAHQFWALVGTLTLAASVLAGALLLEADGYHAASFAAIIGTAVASIAFFYRWWRMDFALRRDLADLKRRYGEVYGRAGISIWQEDWSAVGEAIARLREAGVTDIPAWYAARPKEASELHAKVMITDVNRHSVALMRAKSPHDLIGSLGTILPGSSAAFGLWLRALTNGDDAYFGESVIQRCDGTPFDCLVTASLPKFDADYREIIVSIIDISGYKRDQASLVQAREELARGQRIATVGALTASIAHEVNSPLAAIASNAAACIRWIGRPDPDLAEAREAAEAVIAEAGRARAVIARTRAYLDKAPRVQELRDLRALILDAVRLVEREAHALEVNISLDLARDLGEIRCDPIQLQQAMVNLIVNAIQSMGAMSVDKRLSVIARRQDEQLLIAVEDNGEGIAAADLQRIFEPFYSTKNGGMGMGLSICRATIEAHGGTLQVSSEAGVGTRVDIRLPEMERQ